MAKTDLQYEVTKRCVEMFRAGLADVRRLKEAAINPDAESQLWFKTQEDALSAQLADLEEEVREYEARKDLPNAI